MSVRDFLVTRYAPFRELDPKTIHSYLLTVDRFRDYLGREPVIADLTNDNVAAFLHWRSTQVRNGKTLSVRTTNKDAKVLTSVWEFAARRRELPDMEFPLLKRRKPPERIVYAYSAADIQRLLIACLRKRGKIDGRPSAWWWSTLIYAMFLCGSRIGETLAVRWGDVDLDAGRIRFRAESRKNKTRDIERDIRPDLCDLLRRHVGPADALVWRWEPRHPNSIYPAMQSLCRQAGVAYRKFHGLRKSSASYAAASGGDATEHLDHSSPSITRQHYLAPDIVGRKSVVDLLPELVLPAVSDDQDAEFVPLDD